MQVIGDHDCIRLVRASIHTVGDKNKQRGNGYKYISLNKSYLHKDVYINFNLLTK